MKSAYTLHPYSLCGPTRVHHILPIRTAQCGAHRSRLTSLHKIRGFVKIQAQNDANAEQQKPEEDVPMRQLPETSSASDLGQGNLNDSADGPSSSEPRKRGLFQRIAISFVSALQGFLALIFPPRLRGSWSSLLNVRAIRIGLFFLIGSLMSFASRSARSPGISAPQEVMYSDFLNMVTSGNVRAARFEDGTGRILFDLKPHSSQLAAQAAAEANLWDISPAAAAMARKSRAKTPRLFYTRHIPDPQLIATLSGAGVEFGAIKASVTSGIVRVFATALALWIPLIPLFLVMRRMIEGRNGTARKKKNSGKADLQQRITFADVAGVGAAKAELMEVVDCLKDARRYRKLGAKLPSGVLLCGPPGTGKTLLAKAVAGEAGVPFIAASASEFVELFVGRGAARVRELFAEARKAAPCVVFIDELDAVGGKRGAGLNEERDQTLNQLLTELDGFEERTGVMLLAATNRPEVLDPALLRPGRLSRKVNVPLPDEPARAAILAVHMQRVPIAGGLEGRQYAAQSIARVTSGFNGAELANVVNEAAFLAARRSGDTIEIPDLVEGVQRTRFGVNGGDQGIGGRFGKALKDMLLDISGGKQMRTQPLGS